MPAGRRAMPCKPLRSMKGHLAITNLLIQQGANATNHGGHYGTALQAAAYRGHRDVAEALLNANTETVQGDLCQNAFCAAAQAGQDGIVALFLHRGYCFPESGRHVPLYRIIQPSLPSEDLLRAWSLIRQGHQRRPPKALTSSSGTEVSKAGPVAEFENVFRSVRNLPSSEAREIHIRKPYQIQLDTRVRSGSCSYDGDPLSIAASSGHTAMVKFLLRNRKNLGTLDWHVRQALWAASAGGFVAILKAIMTVHEDLRDCHIGCVERAAFHGHEHVLDFLMQEQNSRAYTWNLSDQRDFRHDFHKDEYAEKLNHSLSNLYSLAVVKFAIRGGQFAVLQRGLERVAAEEQQIMRAIALREAAVYDRGNMIEYLMAERSGFKPVVLSQALETAAEHGSKSALLSLFAYTNEDMVVSRRKALIKAALNGHSDTVQQLVDRERDSHAYGIINQVFVEAARRAHPWRAEGYTSHRLRFSHAPEDI